MGTLQNCSAYGLCAQCTLPAFPPRERHIMCCVSLPLRRRRHYAGDFTFADEKTALRGSAGTFQPGQAR